MKRVVVPVLLAGTLALAGCVAQVPAVNPYPPVPPPQAEIIPKPPVSATPLIWQPGHWEWTGSAYAWSAGTWVARAGHGSLWQPGYWALTTGGWTWVPGHWT